VVVRLLLWTVGWTGVGVTHDLAVAMSLADHLIVMRAGRVVAAGAARAVYERPVDSALGQFLGEALVVPGHIVHDDGEVRVDCVLGRLAVGDWHGGDGGCEVLIRPEHLVARLPVGARDGAIIGTVTAQSYFGHDAMVRVRVPGLPSPVSVRVPGHQGFRVGDRAELEVVQPVSTYSAKESFEDRV
jgi:iron(III) transport system ATP-binding protein